jgi:ABC-2 family transporter protein
LLSGLDFLSDSRDDATMVDLQRVAIVARFECAEALRSRLALVTLLMYGASASIGSYLFLKTLAAVEETARETLSQALGADPASLPANLVREKAMPLLARAVGDAEIGDQLLQMQPLSIFYGFLALNSVTLFVLATSTGSIAGDIATGASRFALVRSDRLSWTLGKLTGQATLLAGGLFAGALLTGLNGLLMESGFQQATWPWLFRTSFRAWIYGVSYLGIFLGISMTARSTMRARLSALVVLIVMSVGHSILDADLVQDFFPSARWLSYVFPAHHQLALWSPDWAQYLIAVASLCGIGAAGFALGQIWFERRDA